jgi:GT2 family glycosyltransferase
MPNHAAPPGPKTAVRPPAEVDVTVLIVSWNVADLLRECLRSLEAERGDLRLQVIVVDNASTDGTVPLLRRDFPEVRLVANAVNLGFARANNLGFEIAEGRHVLLLNPDTRLEPGALEGLAAFLDAHPGAGIVGPLLRFPDGRIQEACAHRFPTLTSFVLCDVLKLPLIPSLGARIFRRYVAPYDFSIPQEVESVSGACMLVRRDTVRRTGGFGDCFVHCGEDIDFCFRTWRAGWTVHYQSDARVVHLQGQSSRQAPIWTSVNAALSIQHYFSRCYGRASGILYRVLVQGLQVPVDLVVGLAKVLLGRETRADLKRRVAIARAILRWRTL